MLYSSHTDLEHVSVTFIFFFMNLTETTQMKKDWFWLMVSERSLHHGREGNSWRQKCYDVLHHSKRGSRKWRENLQKPVLVTDFWQVGLDFSGVYKLPKQHHYLGSKFKPWAWRVPFSCKSLSLEKRHTLWVCKHLGWTSRQQAVGLNPQSASKSLLFQLFKCFGILEGKQY